MELIEDFRDKFQLFPQKKKRPQNKKNALKKSKSIKTTHEIKQKSKSVMSTL